jgi:hypothetical protein
VLKPDFNANDRKWDANRREWLTAG